MGGGDLSFGGGDESWGGDIIVTPPAKRSGLSKQLEPMRKGKTSWNCLTGFQALSRRKEPLYNLRSTTKRTISLQGKRSFEDSDDGVETEEEGMFNDEAGTLAPVEGHAGLVTALDSAGFQLPGSGFTYYKPAFCLLPSGQGSESAMAGALLLVHLSKAEWKV